MASNYVTDEHFANETSERRTGLSPRLREILDECKEDDIHRIIRERHEYLLSHALIYAIGCIQALPEDRQDRETMFDMCEKVRWELDDAELALHLTAVEAKLGHEIDLMFDDTDADELARASRIRQLVDERISGRRADRSTQ